MPSIVPGYEYDIFISYRQNDNRSGWVTEFVQHLNEELAATIKEPVSVYFDSNPHDGLLEMHDVEKSLEGKLKCLIFIPILSQTYCDPKSFAWQHEFCAFNKLAKEDEFGRDIRLSNGNVAGRILPIKIHDLDAEDKATIENEIAGALRAIDFIYTSTGVNRPLITTDSQEKNQSKTFYRDQINKVARSIKELIVGIQHSKDAPKVEVVQKSSRPKTPPMKIVLFASAIGVIGLLSFAYFYFGDLSGKKSSRIDKSVAVLPFTNVNKDDGQDYFSDALTGDIITQLAKIKAMKVISQTSVMLYKKNPKSIREIAKELGVATILAGSVQRVGDQLRINARLINAATDEHLWAELYDRPVKDLFAVQSDVAKQIAIALNATLTAIEKSNIEKAPTSNLEAYAFFQKAQYNGQIQSKERFQHTIQNLQRAIALDKDFALAYNQLAHTYALVVYYQYDLYDKEEASRLARENSLTAITLDTTCAQCYEGRAYTLRTLDWNWVEAEKMYRKAILLDPIKDNGLLLLLGAEGRFEECLDLCKKSLELDPLGTQNFVDIARMYYYAGKYDESINATKAALDLEPEYRQALGQIGCTLERQGLLDSSVVMISKSATRTGTDYEGAGERFDTKPAPYKTYWSTVLKRTLEDAKKKRIPSIIMAILYMRNGNTNEALTSLEKAFNEREGGMVYVNVEPLFEPLHNEPRFKRMVRSMGLIK